MSKNTAPRQRQTYLKAGVNIDAADRVKRAVRDKARITFTSGVLSDIGFFGGLFELKGFKKPVLVSSSDGVGTKIKLACAMGKHNTVGIDIVNHCVNDILTCGASPLFFQDYIAMAKLDHDVIVNIIQGMTLALKETGCALIGGETAEMPGLYPKGEYDLVGFIVGVVEKKNIKNGSTIKAGDTIIGLPSSGLHTNGYSLVRKIFNTDEDPSILNKGFPALNRKLGEALLEPHKCYYPLIKPLLNKIKGLAHITGGGLPGNLPRTLPDGLAAKINKGSWKIPPLFSLIQQQGDIEEEEMYRVFNMGVGMAIVCDPSDVKDLLAMPEAKIIGEVIKRRGKRLVIA